MELIEGLNPQQKEAVLHTEGPLLVLAGAGSGKTRVITHRIAYLIQEKGVAPWNILSLTFTNKAAKEMRDRIEAIIGARVLDIWCGTFHSCCVRILRREIERLGFNRDFVIYDTDDQETLIKDCLERLGYNEKNFPPKQILAYIGRAKDELINPEAYSINAASDFRLRKISNIYTLYQKKLKANNALDFDDILLHTLKIFDENPDVLAYYQEKFKYILVDEYQDTNTAQYMLVSMLAKKHRNICVVGDDDQSIYGWRGANMRNILDFEKHFQGCRVIKLEQNYRSTERILEAANNVIKNNFGRKPKILWTKNSAGEPVYVYRAYDEKDEADFAAGMIRDAVTRGENEYGDFAVLYRINAQSRVFEDAFIRMGVPYRLIGAHRFYDRREIKDIIAYLRAVNNPHDDISLKRIINVPRRGIGKVTLDRAEQLAYDNGVSIYSILKEAYRINELARASAKIKSFVELLVNLRTLAEYLDLTELIKEVIDQSGIVKELEQEDTVEARTRIENIREFQSVVLDFVRNSEEENPGLNDFLAHVSLIADVDNMDNGQDKVVLMTMHSAKGLEFPVVFLAGMEEGVFPSYRSIGEESEMEEERRLCYVGITRAKEKLFLTLAKSRTLFGNTTYNRQSRFIDEIPEDLLKYVGENGCVFNSNTGKPVIRQVGADEWKQRTASFIKAEELNIDELVVGTRVIHKKFGTGTITAREQEGNDFKLEINFDGLGMKRLMASFAKLKSAPSDNM
ncbi:MAG: DNA helicase PcrA [Clostridiaceae bacterium]|jgi:DNA helicase-2/ATP-dependent DNA helicase PcrA|nr:DNA helicase PcrA [Clostridiaceae bacterium]